MTNKTKSSLILLGTILLGIIIGALITSFIRQERIHRMERMPPQERFIGAMDQIIEPTEMQEKKIEKILKKRYEQIAKIKDAYHNEMAVIFDSLHKDLSNVLTEKQRAKIENHFNRVHDQMIQFRLDLWTNELNLSSDQRHSIEKLLEKFDRDLRPGGNGFEPGLVSPPERMTEKIDSLNQEIKKILTPEQKKKFEDLEERQPPFDFPPGRRHRGDRHKPPFPH